MCDMTRPCATRFMYMCDMRYFALWCLLHDWIPFAIHTSKWVSKSSVTETPCCSVLQCVTVCCSVLQCVAVCCSVLQRVPVCHRVSPCVALCCSVLQCVVVCCANWHGRKFALYLSFLHIHPLQMWYVGHAHNYSDILKVPRNHIDHPRENTEI